MEICELSGTVGDLVSPIEPRSERRSHEQRTPFNMGRLTSIVFATQMGNSISINMLNSME